MFGIFDILEYILPSSDRSKHDIIRLEYLSACKLMENETNIMKILPYIPASMFKPLLQSVILKCYMDFINIDFSKKIDDFESMSLLSPSFYHRINEREIVFPDTLRILILNWPHRKLVLRNQIPPLHPHFEVFLNMDGSLASQKEAIGEVGDMLHVFRTFCNRLIHFIMNAVIKCTPSNTKGFSCSLRMLDVSGLGSFDSPGYIMSCYLRPKFILEGILNSTIDTFGHKIDIFADVIIDLEQNGDFEFSKNIFEENLNPEAGISVYFNKIHTRLYTPSYNLYRPPVPSDLYKVLALGRCEYVHLSSIDIDRNIVKNVCTYLPELIGICLYVSRSSSITSLDFLSELVNLEQVNLECSTYQGLIHDISNMSKGLKYLNLSECLLHSNDLEHLANSIHSDTIIELDISCNAIHNDSDAVGLITLCQKLKSVKVLSINNCSLETLSPSAVTKLVNAFKDSASLEFLSIRYNTFSLEITNIIIDGLAQQKSLRYLSLDLPRLASNGRWNDDEDDNVGIFEPDNEEIEYLHNLCKTFHEQINRFRQLPIYISWVLEEE